MYNGLAHTGVGAMVLTVVAVAITAIGTAMRFLTGRGRG